MRQIICGVAVGVALAGCVGKAVNQATIYAPVTGVIQMDVKVPAGTSVSKVQFQVNDKVVGEDTGTSGTDTYSAEVDTTGLPVDTLAKLAAVGVKPDGSTVVLRENYILVETAAAATTDTTATTDDTTVTTDPAATPADDVTTAYRGVTPAATPTPLASTPKVVKLASTKKTSSAKSAKKVTVIHL